MVDTSSEELPQKRVRIEAGSASHKGMVRPLNEDSTIVKESLFGEGSECKFFGLYGVADGLGGYEGGEVASGLALPVLAESMRESLLLPGLKGRMHSSNQESALRVLTEAVKAANSEVYAQAQAKGNGMCTTLAAVLVIDTMAYVANVGDSRAYSLNQGRLRQITNDHSLVASLVTAGEITTGEIYTHPRRNIITRCLGMQPDIEVDLFTEGLCPGDSLLLCSDGLWEMVRDNEIQEVAIRADNAQAACEQLVEIANRSGGVDNTSVIVVRVTG